MSRAVLMVAPAFYQGAWLEATGEPTAPLPDLVADKLVKRGRAVEVEARELVAAVAAEAAALVEAAAAVAVKAPRKRQNRGADAVIDAPAADPAAAVVSAPVAAPDAPAGDAGGLPDLEAVAEDGDEGDAQDGEAGDA